MIMFTLYNFSKSFENFKEDFLPLILPFGILILVFIMIAIVRGRNGD